MKYEPPGNATLAVEVTNISKHGLWLLIHDKEVFLAFENFPWFKDAPIGKVVHVELASEQHLYWPELDVDLEVESVFDPERYPLISKVSEADERYSDLQSPVPWDEEKIDDSILAGGHHRQNGPWAGIAGAPVVISSFVVLPLPDPAPAGNWGIGAESASNRPATL